MEIQKARQFLIEKEKKEAQLAELRFAEAERIFAEISHLIITNYRPLEIRKCGSLLFKNNFSEKSDIDVAIRGIDFRSLLELYLQVETMSTHHIHLIDIDGLSEPDKKVLLKYSKIIYRASSEAGS